MKKFHIKPVLKSISLIVLIVLLSCEKEEKSKFHLTSIGSNTYYSDEIIPEDYKMIYGKWKLYNVSGGFSGGGHDLDYDFLEIKNIGIYGLIKGDSLIEYGKIELNNIDDYNSEFLPVNLIPTFYNSENPHIHPPERYINLSKDSLNLISPCCDMYNYHYIKVR